jgi:hypothetical protein
MIKVCLFSVLFSTFVTMAQSSVLIENVTIISPHLAQPQPNMNVLIEEGRITQITKKTDRLR